MLLYWPHYTAQIPGVTGHVCWERDLSLRRVLSGKATVPGQPASAPSLVMSEKAVTAHRDITALFSLLSCLTPPVPLFLLLLFSLNVSVSPHPGFLFCFFSFCSLRFIHCPFFSLSLSLAFFLSLFGSLYLSACYTPPLLGKALVWYHITADPGISGRRAEADGQPVRLCVPSLCPPSSRILQLWEPG